MAYILRGVSETDLQLGFTQAQLSSFTDEKLRPKEMKEKVKTGAWI